MILTSLSNDELNQLILTSVLTAIRLSTESSIANPQLKEIYLNQPQAAEFLQIPKSTLYSYTSKRLIPHYKTGKRLVFKQSDLEAWLSENKKKTVSEIENEVYNFQNKKGGRK